MHTNEIPNLCRKLRICLYVCIFIHSKFILNWTFQLQMFWFSKICSYPLIPHIYVSHSSKYTFFPTWTIPFCYVFMTMALDWVYIRYIFFYQFVAYYLMDSIFLAEYESNIALVMEIWSCTYFCSMKTSSNGNIFRVTGLLRGEFTGHQWSGAFIFSLIYAWANKDNVGDLKHHRAHYDVTVMRVVPLVGLYPPT